MTLPAYPAYKDSGVEWLGEVPAHWRAVPLKYLVSFRSGGTPSKDIEAYWNGDVPWASAKDMKLERLADTADHLTEQALADGAATLVEAGAVLVVVRGMILARLFPVCLLEQPMAINQDLKAILAGSDLDSGFLAWALRGTSEESLRRLDEAGHGTKALRMEAWTSLALALPPLPEQTAIAAFLDRETAKIDALVAEQERLIELLAEKRRAVVSHAVTKGLDPNAPMKDSGIAWLGEVPAHWEALTVRRVAQSVQTGGTPASGAANAEVDEGLDWYTPGDFDGAMVLAGASKKMPLDLVSFGEIRKFDAGSILVVSIGATLGKVGLLRTESSANQQINAVQFDETIDNFFAFYVLLSKLEEMRFLSNSSTIGIMNQEKLKDISLVRPPLAEQRAIVAHLDRVTADLDALTDEATRAVALLKERRAALISAAVTGKIDVRGSVEEAA